MIEHDNHVGTLLKALDDLGIANNTIVVYSTDNGPHMNTWPDGAMTPFRSEKNTNWEGAFRVPCLVRWPGKIKPGTITNELMSHNDWIPTLCAIAGEPDIVGKCLKGYDDKHGNTYKVHLDGYDQSKFLTTVEGTVGKNNGVKSARDRFYYTDDDGLLVGMRLGDYKASFAEQRMPGTMAVWGEPFTKLRLTKLYNLMQDPFERADITSNTYWDWIMNHVPQVYQGMEGVTNFVASFKEFPPRSVPPSFNPANMLEDTLREIKAKQKIERAFPMLRTEPAAEGSLPGTAEVTGDSARCVHCRGAHRGSAAPTTVRNLWHLLATCSIATTSDPPRTKLREFIASHLLLIAAAEHRLRARQEAGEAKSKSSLRAYYANRSPPRRRSRPSGACRRSMTN